MLILQVNQNFDISKEIEYVIVKIRYFYKNRTNLVNSHDNIE